MKNKLTKASFISIIIIYLTLNISLIDKTPFPFSDENFFANHAYSLTGKENLSSTPFENRLSAIAASTTSTNYGPIFFWILAIPLKFFNYSIVTVRLTSVFLGTVTIITAFFLTKTLTKSRALSLLTMLLLSIEFHFLISARVARPEIAVMLFSYISFLFYVRTWNNPSNKNHLLTSFFCTFGLFTHFLSGVIPIAVILSHSLLTKKGSLKGFLLLISLPIVSLLFFILQVFHFRSQSQMKDAYQILSGSFIPSFASLEYIFHINIFTKGRFVIYLISFLLLLIHRKKNDSKIFCLLIFFVTFLIAIYRSSSWYLGLLTFPALLCLVNLKKPPLPVAFLISLVIFSSVADQTLTLHFSSNYSYNNYGEEISSKIEPNSKVFITELQPDPYLYLVEKRPDLKLGSFQAIDNYKKSLSLADSVIANTNDVIAADKIIRQYNLNPIVVNFLKSHPHQIFSIQDTVAGQIAVVKLLK